MALIEIQNLNFQYPNETEYALKNLSLSIEAGEFLVLCGPSGCGKSTLLGQLKTVLAPHGNLNGTILYRGIPLSDTDSLTQATEIGFVSQSPENQIVTDKVWHELAFGLESLGLDTPSIRARVAEMAAFFGIEEWFHRNVTELSGGQKQLLNLASVMTMQPQLLILDEPTAQLDPIAAEEFLSVLGKINRELGTTIVLTEHRLEEAFPLAASIAVMDQGCLLCKGTPRAVGSMMKDSNHSIFLSFPTPMRIWAAVDQTLECPVTVSEGRAWLESYTKTHSLSTVVHKVHHCDSEIVISATDLWFRYEKDTSDILRGLNLQIRKGEFFALMGGNGSGKTTTLRLLSGLLQAYRGTVHINGSLTALPQNPQTLFVSKTVRGDLYEMFSDVKIAKEILDQKIARVVTLCKLDSLLDRHPYDLSGGEQQRAALAKVLLTEPDILFLDEPTKGFDADFKQQFAGIIRDLLSQGITVFMVSHDIEFCARYTHRIALFFDGSIVTENTPEHFFSENSFYTTAASRMARKQLPSAIIPEDVIQACGGTLPPEEALPHTVSLPLPKEESADWKPPKLPLWRKLIAMLSGAMALVDFIHITRQTDLTQFISASGITADGSAQLTSYAVLIVLLFLFAISTGKKSKTSEHIQTPRNKRVLIKRTRIAAIMIFLCIPLTLFIGLQYFDRSHYYFIAFSVLIESMFPFFLLFEGRKPKARELVTIAVLCAIGIAGRVVFFMLPQFKPVAALTIVAGIAFGGETGFLVGAMTMLTSNILFSQGPWTPWQMFAMGIIGFLAGILFRKGLLRQTRLSMCIFGTLSVILIYGGIMNPVSALLWSSQSLNKEILLSYYISGFPMDLVHASATFLFLWFGAEPMLEKLDRIKTKYGLIE